MPRADRGTLTQGPAAARRSDARTPHRANVRSVPLDPRVRVQLFVDALLSRDGAGGSWLGPLLRAAPRGQARLGELALTPGWLQTPLAVRTATGRRGAFDHLIAPSRQLLGWLIDHPQRLTWPPDDASSAETVRLRRALIDDDPPGARARAQDRAHDLLRRSTGLGRSWWRFEEATTAECVLSTDRLVIVVQGRRAGEPPTPATPWFPERSTLIRDLEAARRLADGGKAWGALVLCDGAVSDAGDAAVAAAVSAGAPQLDAGERQDLADAYLGELSFAQAAAAVGLELTDVPGWNA